MKFIQLTLMSWAVVIVAAASAAAEQARGIVYHDQNNNGQRDKGEKGLSGVLVSNGEDIVRTDRSGAYTLSVSDDAIVFVIKPSGWRTAQAPRTQLQRFYYIHKP